VQQAWQAGIVVVVSAGNEGRNNSAGTQGYATITVPGNSPFVITVGAMNTVGTLTRVDDKITLPFPARRLSLILHAGQRPYAQASSVTPAASCPPSWQRPISSSYPMPAASALLRSTLRASSVMEPQRASVRSLLRQLSSPPSVSSLLR